LCLKHLIPLFSLLVFIAIIGIVVYLFGRDSSATPRRDLICFRRLLMAGVVTFSARAAIW
jgi:hypothetical protein